MLKPSVTSAPTADMATLTVVQPLTLDRGKGAARPPGCCVPSASLSVSANCHRDRRTRSGRGSRESEEGEGGKAFAPRAGYFLPLFLPATSPLSLHAVLARPRGALAGLWRPRRHSQPLAGSPPGRLLCWSGCAGTARRPGLGVAEGQGGSSPCRAGAPVTRRPGKPGGGAA